MARESVTAHDATTVEIDGERLVAFAGCSYLGLAHDRRVRAAAERALRTTGVSTSASRETSGNQRVHDDLESRLAAFLSADHPDAAGVLTLDGLTANLAAAQSLSGTHARAVLDERAHASLFDAARFAGLEIGTYRHRDAHAAEARVGESDRPAVIMTDGVFATDGGAAPVRALRGVLGPGDVLLVDDCHGFCVLGPRGRGSCIDAGFEVGVDPAVIVTTTLAKGLGCGGGVVVGTADRIGRIRPASSVYRCTTPISPVLAAAGLAALDLLESDPLRVEQLRRNAARLREACEGADVVLFSRSDAGRASIPIQAFAAPGRDDNQRLEATLRRLGVYVPLVDYPGGPAPEYFRASVTSEHTPDQIELLAEALRGAAGARISAGEATCEA